MKVFLVKILSVVDPENEEQRSWVGKYINDILYAPGGYEFHYTMQAAAEETIEHCLCAPRHPRLYDYEKAKHSLGMQMIRKHLHGFAEIEYWEVEL